MEVEERGSGGLEGSGSATKRKRSVSLEAPPAVAQPPSKTAKTSSHHLQINYLARQYTEILPMVSADDPLPNVLQLLSDYTGVLERHESLAGNLGAKPLGPILIQRFERLFDGQPRVLKSNGKDGGPGVTWLDVVDFARQKPEQFNLEKSRDSVRVCQFYTKQSRVEISEDDYTLIASGLPQKLIPPQPIPEDEEKELGTLEIMEKKIASVIQLADQVSARARQTKHRVAARKHAIVSRREAEALAENARTNDDESVPSPAFRPVNSHRPERLNGILNAAPNGRNYLGASASPTTHAELLNLFSNGRQQRMGDTTELATPTSARPPSLGSKSKSKPVLENIDYASILLNSASPVPIPSTPSTLQNASRQTASQAERYDDSGPYKAEMLSRMENMARGERVNPPCDRCRRLHIDCLKNLTACLGCTKKHAKCSWKDVSKQELADNPFTKPRIKPVDLSMRAESADDDKLRSPGEGAPNSEPVRDEELLGEDDSDDDIAVPPRPVVPLSLHETSKPESTPEHAKVEEASPDLVKPPNPAVVADLNKSNGNWGFSHVGVMDVDTPVPAKAEVKAELASPTLGREVANTAPTTEATVPAPPVEAIMASPIEAIPKEQVERAAINIIERRLEEREHADPAPMVNGFASVNQQRPPPPPPAQEQPISKPAPTEETGLSAANGDTETRNVASIEVAAQNGASTALYNGSSTS